MSERQVDFLIVGGGSAGCVLANRLSEDPSNQVLVLEAGRPDSRWDVFIHMPAALTIPIGSRFYDWRYESEPEPHLNDRRIYHARGKVLGGSSSINGMIFQRGNPLDYEKWATKPGLQRWDYAHCLPYFRRMESLQPGPSEPDPQQEHFRGEQGPLHLERGPGTNPLFDAFLEAAEQAGFPRTPDVNGFCQEGFGLFDRNVRRGRRWSAARAYLHPVLSRPNLRVKTRAFIQEILFDGHRAIGVVCNGERILAGETILCAGAFNSPQLLQLSGVGDPEHLKSVGVEPRVDLSGVGENMQDHLEVYVQYACKRPVSMNPQLAWWRKPWLGFQWLFLRSGAAATNHFEAGGFARSNDEVPYPNLMFHFLPLAIRYDGSSPSAGHGYQVHIGPMYSNSTGSVKIRSSDPREHPALSFNYLSTESDRREWLEAIATARRILNQPALDEFNGGEISPGPSVETDEQVLDWIAKDAETALHPSCTCTMGTGPDAVTDPDTLRVHGTEGLRVVDASTLPSITNGNIYAPVMMLAERASDLILGKTPLAAETVPFFCHT
ncbi:MAG: choline dehydrogenase [Acidobacteriota bacterium]